MGLPWQQCPWPIPGVVQACHLNGVLPLRFSTVRNCHPHEQTFYLLQQIKWNLSERVRDTGRSMNRERAENRSGGDRQTDGIKLLVLLVAPGQSTFLLGQVCCLSWE